jgi:hypothetical protein
VADRIVHLLQVQLDGLGKVREGLVNRVTRAGGRAPAIEKPARVERVTCSTALVRDRARLKRMSF